VLYTRGQIYRYGLGDQRKAAQIFQSLITEYPTHPTANSARAELESMELSRKILTELDSKENIPQKLTLRNYPNPFNPGTTIHFSLPRSGQVVLKIYDIQGREVITLVNEKKSAGHYEVYWDGTNRTGQPVASGTYFYQLRFGDQAITRKMLLLK